MVFRYILRLFSCGFCYSQKPLKNKLISVPNKGPGANIVMVWHGRTYIFCTAAQPSTMPSKFALDPPLVGVAVAAVFAGAAVELGKVDVNV